MGNQKTILPNSNEIEINRLIDQAISWEEETEFLLERIGIQQGWKCADLGCGPIGILRPLSLRVGKSGHVLGLDSNPMCVKTAQTYIKDNQLKNVEVVQGDLYRNNLQPRSFNLTHFRFVFTQQGCDENLLKKTIRLTRPGGIVVSQESDWTTWNCYPTNPFWEKIRNALITAFELNGGDINAGRRTFKMFKEIGLSNVNIRTAIQALPVGDKFRSGMNQMALSMREKILKANILREKEFNQALMECDAILDDSSSIIISYILCQVWGMVNKS